MKIVSDSSSNVRNITSDIEFKSVPLKILVDDKEFVDDVNGNVQEMVDYLKTTKSKSSTSCPNSQDYLSAFENSEEIIVLTLTSALSGSYNASETAQKEYLKGDLKAKVFCFDTLTTGPEMSLIIDKIVELYNNGENFESIVEKIKEYKKHTHLVFLLKSLRNLANNGRVSPIVAKISSLIGIEIISKASDEGTIKPLKKVIGKKKGLFTLYEEIKKNGFNGGKITIAHCFNESGVNDLKTMILKDFPSANIKVEECGMLCSFYAENGGILVGFEDYKN